MQLSNLRRARMRKLLTQRELAAKAGVTQATVALLEGGRTKARISTVRKLAAALGIDHCELIGDGDDGQDGAREQQR